MAVGVLITYPVGDQVVNSNTSVICCVTPDVSLVALVITRVSDSVEVLNTTLTIQPMSPCGNVADGRVASGALTVTLTDGVPYTITATASGGGDEDSHTIAINGGGGNQSFLIVSPARGELVTQATQVVLNSEFDLNQRAFLRAITTGDFLHGLVVGTSDFSANVANMVGFAFLARQPYRLEAVRVTPGQADLVTFVDVLGGETKVKFTSLTPGARIPAKVVDWLLPYRVTLCASPSSASLSVKVFDLDTGNLVQTMIDVTPSFFIPCSAVDIGNQRFVIFSQNLTERKRYLLAALLRAGGVITASDSVVVVALAPGDIVANLDVDLPANLPQGVIDAIAANLSGGQADSFAGWVASLTTVATAGA